MQQDLKKELEMNNGSQKAQIEIEEYTTLNNTNKWATAMKVSLLKNEEHKRNRGCGFIKRMKVAWDDIYRNSTMRVQTSRDNTIRYSVNKIHYSTL